MKRCEDVGPWAGRPRAQMMKSDEVEAILHLRELGWGLRRIAREFGCSKNTVKRYVAVDGWTAYSRRTGGGKLEDQAAWLKERFFQHRGNAEVVRQDLLRERSVDVSLRTVERAVAPFRRLLAAEAKATVRSPDSFTRRVASRSSCSVASSAAASSRRELGLELCRAGPAPSSASVGVRAGERAVHRPQRPAGHLLQHRDPQVEPLGAVLAEPADLAVLQHPPRSLERPRGVGLMHDRRRFHRSFPEVGAVLNRAGSAVIGGRCPDHRLERPRPVAGTCERRSVTPKSDSSPWPDSVSRTGLFAEQIHTYARPGIRHGIRHTVARAGRRPRSRVPNDRLRHMLIGYARVSKADGSQSLALQRDARQAAGVDAGRVYHDFASGVRDDRPGLDNCRPDPELGLVFGRNIVLLPGAANRDL